SVRPAVASVPRRRWFRHRSHRAVRSFAYHPYHVPWFYRPVRTQYRPRYKYIPEMTASIPDRRSIRTKQPENERTTPTTERNSSGWFANPSIGKDTAEEDERTERLSVSCIEAPSQTPRWYGKRSSVPAGQRTTLASTTTSTSISTKTNSRSPGWRSATRSSFECARTRSSFRK